MDSLEEAVDHINAYGSHHSDAIINENDSQKEQFLKSVDSACVYANASTRFTDGYEFGLAPKSASAPTSCTPAAPWVPTS